jgi:two-component system, cell cycle sensor histidine kinase and response regulator CckA
MDRETQDKLFEPFFTTKFTGRGLGMAAVLGIVRSHNGAIKVYSEVDCGTIFKVLFPVMPQGEGANESQAEIAPGVGDEAWNPTGTVLLVDDEETVLDVGRRMLEKMGFLVLDAANGREATEIYRKRADLSGPEAGIACVLLDLTMPEMDGEEAFRELRRIHPGVRVILCSGYNEQESMARFAGKGLAGFIQKPYRYAALMEKIREVLTV